MTTPTAPPAARAALRRARDWFLAIQNSDGGFGESANSYLDRSLMGQGESTASQTAWAVMTLMNLLPIDHSAITRAIEWLVRDQLVADKKAFERGHTRRPESESPERKLGVSHANPRSHTRSTHNPELALGAPSDPQNLHTRDPVTDLAGGWCEHFFTGTGFPKVFYLRYHLYRHSFPLKALARWKRLST